MANNVSAGLLMYVREADALFVLLVHPGGPFWRGKDLGAWSIPKGAPEEGEDLLDAAQREFFEETALTAQGPFVALQSVRQKAGKLVHCWAFESARPEKLSPGASTMEIEWPRRSGHKMTYPEVDDVRLFSVDEALKKILPAQAAFIPDLLTKIS